MSGKQKLYRLAFFSIITFLLLFGFSALVDKGVRHSSTLGFEKVNRILVSHIDPDIISFGSSSGERGFNCRFMSAALGISAYNSCMAGTDFNQIKCLIRSYNSYSSKKSTVLLFETFSSLHHMQAIASVERFAAHLDNRFVYHDLYNIDPELTWRSRYIPLYKSTVVDHTYYGAAIGGWENLLFHRSSPDTLLGFLPNYRGWPADEDAVLEALKPIPVSIDNSAVTDYVALINELQQKGKRVVIVISPVVERFYSEKVDYTPVQRTLDSVARVTGCTFFNLLRSDISKNKRYFFNATHLNYEGSLLLCRQLADSLKKKS
jgi:hypothetical protein